jgi:hypothetical protein
VKLHRYQVVGSLLLAALLLAWLLYRYGRLGAWP